MSKKGYKQTPEHIQKAAETRKIDKNDIIGNECGRLIVVKYAWQRSKYHYYWCLCDCGEWCIIQKGNLLHNNTKSCGCLNRLRRSENGRNNKGRSKSLETRQKLSESHKGKFTGPDNPAYKHGDSGTRLYTAWCNMLQRCNKSYHPSYHRYGGRGIKVCDEWNDYFTFKQWALDNGCESNLWLDRINNNLGYFPKNCRWVTPSESNKNKTHRYIAKKYDELVLENLKLKEQLKIVNGSPDQKIQKKDQSKGEKK